MAVPNSRSEEELEKDLTQPAENFRIIGVGPTNKQIDDARKRIKNGEKESRVFDELLGEVLAANVRFWEERLESLTE